jgi:PKD repeat protein
MIFGPLNGIPPSSMIPVASFTTDDPNPEVGDTMDFFDTSTNNPTSWTWTLNGSLFSNDQNPTGLYVNAQNPPLVMELTVSNAFGSSSTSTTYYPSLP